MGRTWVALSLGIVACSVWGRPGRCEENGTSLLDAAPRGIDFSYLWWANGWDEKGPVPPLLLCLRTGHYGMVLDAETLRLPHLGAFKESVPAEKALSEGREVLFSLPEGSLDLEIAVDGTTYTCLAGAIGWQDRSRWVTFPVRIVESGRFLQHVQVHGLVFEEPEGGQLPADAWLDVKAMPHRFELSLHVVPEREWVDGEMRLELESHGKIQYQGRSKDKWTGPWEAGEERNITLHVSFAMKDDLEDMEEVRVEYRPPDKEEWIELEDTSQRRLLYRIDLPERSWSVQEDPDHRELVHVRVANQGTEPVVVPLLFAKEHPFPGITGMCPMVLDPAGNPTGIPVQLSKNWHRQEEIRLLHEGPWFRGVTLFHLPPESELLFQFCIAYARWGGIPAASHAQLCLIGWGSNQVWDQSAIGSWGETICYEPDACQRRCMIDDLRPLMVTSMDANSPRWTWTHNVGGGDFLLVFDARGRYVPHKGVRTFYRSRQIHNEETIGKPNLVGRQPNPPFLVHQLEHLAHGLPELGVDPRRGMKISSGSGRTLVIGPPRNVNFPWILLDSALHHYLAISRRAHGKREETVIAGRGGESVVRGWPPGRRAAFAKWFGGCLKGTPDPHREQTAFDELVRALEEAERADPAMRSAPAGEP